MPRSIEDVIVWTRDPAHHSPHQGGSWHNRCEQYTNNAGNFTQSFSTAFKAAQASGPLTSDLTGIPNGAIGYWRGVVIGGEECGHTAFWYNGEWWMASDAVTNMVGKGTGSIAPAEYARRRPFAKWLGWTLRHGTETLAGSAPAGVALRALPGIRSNQMYLTWTTDGTGWLVTEQGWTGLPSPQVYNLFHRLITSKQNNSPFINGQTPETFNRAEVDIMSAQQRLIAVGVQLQTQIDPVQLAAALSEALGTTISATLPASLMEKMDQIERGVEGIELTPEDFDSQAFIDPIDLSAAFEEAAPRVEDSIRRSRGTVPTPQPG
jgi:hypothetical protein